MRLSPPQVELLTDIATKPQMYVGTWGPWGRTARALVSRGLAAMEDVDHAQSEVKITVDGQKEAIRRGTLCECGRGASDRCPDTGECISSRCTCVKCRPELNCHCPDANREQGNHLDYCPVSGGAGIPDYVPFHA